jgi:hypothetical protein
MKSNGDPNQCQLTSELPDDTMRRSAGATDARWVFPALDRYCFEFGAADVGAAYAGVVGIL